MKIRNFISYTKYGFSNKKFNAAVLFIDTAILVYSIISFIGDASKPASYIILGVSLLMNVIWQGYSSLNDILKYYKKNGLVDYMFSDDEIDYERFLDEKEGLSLLRLKRGVVAVSPRIDEWIRENDVDTEEDRNAERLVKTYVENNFENLLPFLTRHYKRAVADDRLFSNDTKLCFSGRMTDIDTFRVSRGCYYNSFLTNKLFNQKLVSDDGVDMFPVKGCTNTDIKVPYRCFSNEIGISALAVTRDGYMFFQVQGNHSDSSAGLIVPSGSGSADWDDYTKNKGASFRELISYSTKRELAEETGTAIDGVVKSKVIGFYRWMNQAGKPEFVSLSKLSISRSEISPQKEEQQKNLNDKYMFRLVDHNGEINKAAFDEIVSYLDDPSLSIPLYMCILFMKEYCEADPEGFKALVG